jgi:hypothetical protein
MSDRRHEKKRSVLHINEQVNGGMGKKEQRLTTRREASSQKNRVPLVIRSL